MGELEAAVAAYVEGFDLAADDPRALTGMLAVRLARSLDGRTSAAVVRELRECVDQLDPDDGGEDGSRAVELLRGLLR